MKTLNNVSSSQKLFIAFSLGVFLTLSPACKHPGSENLSLAKHKQGQYISKPYRWLYYQLSEAEILTYMKAKYGRSAEDVQGPVTERIQFLAERIHVILKSKHPDQLSFVPDPLVKVIKSDIPNAFSDGVDVCYSGPIKYGNSNIERSAKLNYKVNQMYFNSKHSPFTTSSYTGPCRTINVPPNEFASYLYDKLRGSCTASLLRSGNISIPQGCLKDTIPSGVYSGVSFKTTQNLITITTSFLKELLKEEELIFVLAHELTHYYKAHYAFSDRYGYFYKKSRESVKSFPRRYDFSLGYQALEDANTFIFHQVPKARLHSSLFQSSRTTINPELVCKNEPCSNDCREYEQFLKSTEFHSMTEKEQCGLICTDSSGYFPYVDLEPKFFESYKKFENKLIKCGANLTLDQFSKVDLERLLNYSSNNIKREIFNSINKSMTLSDFLLDVSMRSFYYDSVTRKQNYDKINQENLGFYTLEQEADEVALDIVNAIGVNPNYAVDFERRQLKTNYKGASAGFYQVTQSECVPYLNQDFSNYDQLKFPPIGNILDPYHNHCTRIFNMLTQISVQNYMGSNAKGSKLNQTQNMTLKPLSQEDWLKLTENL